MPTRPDSQQRRVAISVEYDGSSYRGWQTQAHDNQVVQTKIEQALSKIAAEPISVTCAGRTDSGVHASSQVCHFDTWAIRDPYNWVMGVNSQLPGDISVAWALEVDPSFHARFGALSRQYVYLIKCSSSRSALLKNVVTLTHHRLDPQLMAVAAQSLIGTYDFNAFRSAQCRAKMSVRSVTRLSVHYHDQLIAVHVEANSFLQHMVRNIVGVLMAIGAKEQPISWVNYVLASRDRTKGGVTAPSHGLYFLGPTYCDDYNLPDTVRIPQIARDILRTDPLECVL
ncbi:MAG: tRNA pseudouridine(38-40) synthase TruA [Gammaproteobacteria bacterium]|nr:tRNA pseudouridine(38-40) synthase TruA [Gammaproteobacteria bacterium]HAN79877.1 tRNA pseudouridine(38-40) synthase TruA [Gammaproteobacteria bacterium]